MNATNAGGRKLRWPRFERTRRRRNGALAVVAIVVAGTLAACGTSSNAKSGSGDSYKVAIVADMSGSFATFGNQAVAGINAAIAEINGAGGVNGRKIEVTKINDSLSTPDGAQVAIRAAYDQHPIAILSGWTSGSIAATAPLMTSHGDTAFIAYTAPDDLLFPPKKWYFSVGSTTAQQVAYMAAGMGQLVGGLKGARIGIEAINTPGAIAQVEGITKLLASSGAQIVTNERTATGAVASFGSEAAKMVAAKPDVIMFLDTPANVITAAKAIVANGYKGPLLANEGGADQSVFEAINLPNFYMAWPYDVPTSGSTVYDAAAKSGNADKLNGAIRGEFGWIIVRALADGLKHCNQKPCTNAGLISALPTLSNIDLGGSDIAWGPVGFSNEKHYAVSKWQILSWDPAKKQRVPYGPPLSVNE